MRFNLTSVRGFLVSRLQHRVRRSEARRMNSHLPSRKSSRCHQEPVSDCRTVCRRFVVVVGKQISTGLFIRTGTRVP